MRKRLLLAALAMVSAVSSFAFEVGEYAYTATQRLKVTGENTVQNSTFAEGLNVGGWCGLTAIEEVSAITWKVSDGEGPNGETVLQSQGATADEPICNVWSGLYGGQTYIVSFMIKGESAATSTVGTTVGSNYMDFFLNADGSLTHAASTDEAPVVDVATAFNITTEWQTVSFVFTPDEGQQLVMHFEKLATGTMITNFSINTVMEVYDDRVARRKVDFANKILADANFNTDAAATAREDFVGGVYDYIVKGLAGDPEGCDFDDISNGEQMMAQFDEGLAAFMDASSDNLATEANFKYVTDLTTFPKKNRKDLKGNKTEGGFMFRMDGVADGGETNWQHASGADFIQQAIQGTYSNGAGSVALYNTNLPAGKYYFAVETRVANMDKNYVKTYNLEKGVKLFIGSDSTESVTILGDGWEKLYTVKELKEGETFEAGIWWEGHDAGSAFEVKNFECRSFGDVAAEAERKAAWTTFIAQYNAAVSARNTLIELQSDANYPWEKDSLARALTQWDPYYNDIMAKGWVDQDGNDTRVATVDQLTDWADYQGVEISDGEGGLLKYQLVRGYQNAINYVKAQNKVFDDLKAEITKAEILRDDDMNQLGDKTTFQLAIDAAKNTLTTTLATTTDATREADELTLNTAISTLQTAEETFKNSVPEMSPIIDIDFSNNFEPVYTITPGEGDEPGEAVLSSYAIKGAKGQMDFTLASVTDNGDGTFANDQVTFALGCGGAEATNTDVLRVGKGTATVNLIEGDIPTDADVLRVNFDVWFGALVNRNVEIQLQNAAGERVAGFSYCLYGPSVAYNDFYNQNNEGLNIPAWGKSTGKDGNAALLVDKYMWQFDIIIDYKANTAQANLLTSPNGATQGGLVALTKELEDNKIAKFVLSSNYDNVDRRSWFDNLKIFKYASQAEGENEQVGITSVNANMQATGAIYTLSGVQVKGVPAKGLYIKDGKKFVIK